MVVEENRNERFLEVLAIIRKQARANLVEKRVLTPEDEVEFQRRLREFWSLTEGFKVTPREAVGLAFESLW